MQSWRRIALEPSALRSADRYLDPQVLGADGAHLPGTLFRIANLEGTDPHQVYARVAGRLSDLGGLRVQSLNIAQDDVRELLTIELKEPHGLTLPARSLSEGTLRFLALSAQTDAGAAGGLSGRRLEQFQKRFPQNRLRLLSLLDPAGSVASLPSWRAFVSDLDLAFESWMQR
jgi:hypothetical protein